MSQKNRHDMDSRERGARGTRRAKEAKYLSQLALYLIRGIRLDCKLVNLSLLVLFRIGFPSLLRS